jgi:adenylosuccinate synthase
MLRRGRRAIEVMETEWMWDGKLNGNVLCEGAQSVWLDVDHGDYPYVTSSTTMPYGACSLGFSPRKIGTLYGVAKIYDTKSGVDPLFPETLWDDPVLDKIIQEGGEFGTTTGRKRLVNWLNLDKLIQSIRISGCGVLIINKCDVLETVGVFKLIHNNEVMEFQSMEEMKNYIYHIIIMFSDDVEVNDVVFSGNKETVGI